MPWQVSGEVQKRVAGISGGGQKGWTWGRLMGVMFDLNTSDLVQVERMELKQRTCINTWLRLFQCIHALIKRRKVCRDLSNGSKKIYYCLPQEPDFQVRVGSC